MGKYAEKFNHYAEKKKAAKLVAHLKDRDKETRFDAIRALGRCGGEDAVNHLTTMLITPDADERAEVVRALGNCGTSATFSHLRYYIDRESDPTVRAAMQEALGKLHSTDQN